MKVIVVTNMYPTKGLPFYGIFVKQQIESLRKLGVTVDVFNIRGRQNRLNYLSAFPKLIGVLATNKYDIIHTHHTYCVFPIVFARGLLRLETPVILTFHESEFMKPYRIRDSHIDLLKRFAYSKRIKKIALKMADLVIPVWEGLTKAVGCQGEETAIPCGVDLELFKPVDREECRERLNLPMSKKIIFFPANVADLANTTGKGYELFQRAVNYLAINYKDFLVITGGKILHEEMPYYMNTADVVVQTSHFEASPMVVKEAMAVNVPMVSTDVGDTKMLFGSTPGYYICEKDPEDVATKIKEAFNFKGRTRGRERILDLRLSLEQVAKTYLKIYQEIINKTKCN